MLCSVEHTILVVVDLQGKIYEATASRRELGVKVPQLVEIAGVFGVPVLLTEQYPKGLGVTHTDIREKYDALETPKALVEKTSFGCWGDVGFRREVAALSKASEAKPTIVIVGIEAHICVLQTALGMRQDGFEVVVVEDCLSSSRQAYKENAIRRLAYNGCEVVCFESLLFEWTRDKENKHFKFMSHRVTRVAAELGDY